MNLIHEDKVHEYLVEGVHGAVASEVSRYRTLVAIIFPEVKMSLQPLLRTIFRVLQTEYVQDSFLFICRRKCTSVSSGVASAKPIFDIISVGIQEPNEMFDKSSLNH